VVTLVFLIRCTQLIMKMKLFILALLLSKTEEVRLVHKWLQAKIRTHTAIKRIMHRHYLQEIKTATLTSQHLISNSKTSTSFKKLLDPMGSKSISALRRGNPLDIPLIDHSVRKECRVPIQRLTVLETQLQMVILVKTRRDRILTTSYKYIPSTKSTEMITTFSTLMRMLLRCTQKCHTS